MSPAIRRFCSGLISDTFLTYTTVKVVKVPNTLIAIIYRLLQFAIIAYIALYIVWYKNGYQEFQEPRGTSVIKVKGVAKVTGNDAVQYLGANSELLWDTAEYQLPPLENNAFFIATRQTVTYDQTVTTCTSALEDRLFCNRTSTDKDQCRKGDQIPNTFGYYTGNCNMSKENPSRDVCEIYAWCPEELSRSTDLLMNSSDVESFTVYLKTIVSFALFDITLRNVQSKTNFTCRYDKNNDPRCPILRIGDIINSLNTNKTALFSEGGLIEIRQDWTCNFDYDKDKCYPKLEFRMLQSGDDSNSPGVNYRSAQKYRVNGIDFRTLSKIYGLRFVVTISGKGGQFNIVNLFVAIGSGIGFMVIAGIVCDAIFMYIHKSRDRYRERKFSVCEVSSTRSSSDENLKPVMTFQTPHKPSTESIYSDGF